MKTKNLLIIMSAIILIIPLVSALVLADNVYVISGEIKDGSAELDSLYLLGSETDYEEDESLGDYSAGFYSGTSLIKVFYFDVTDVEYDEETIKYFMFSAIIPDETDKIVFKDNAGQIFYELNKTQNSPVVDNVVITEQGEDYLINWQGVDADEDEIYYTVNYYDLRYLDWVSVVMDITDTDFLLDSVALPGGETIIKIQASDGFNIGEAVSDNFIVPNKAPSVLINSPLDESVFTYGEEVLLEGWTYDLETGESDSYFWQSSIDGILGMESSFITDLSLGEHEITLKSTDGELIGSDSIHLTITEETRPDISIDEIEFYPEEVVEGDDIKIVAIIHNIIIDAVFDYAFYDGDPLNGGVLIDEWSDYAYANEYMEIEVLLESVTAGVHDIYLVISNSDLEESDESNNIASVEVNSCLMADVDCDGFVSGADLSRIFTNWGMQNAFHSDGDVNGDGFVGGLDYGIVLTNWGESV